MGILKRVCDLVSANIHEAFDQLEDPVVMMNQYLRNLEEEISRVETTLARQEASEQLFSRLIMETEALVEKRLRQAKLAVETGEEEIAKLAIADKLEAETKLAEYRNQLDTISEQTRQIREQFDELVAKYHELKSRKMYLISRFEAVQSIRRMNGVIHAIDTKSAVKGFERMEERVRMMEFQAAIKGRVRKIGQDSQFASYELHDRIQEELAKLKIDSK